MGASVFFAVVSGFDVNRTGWRCEADGWMNRAAVGSSQRAGKQVGGRRRGGHRQVGGQAQSDTTATATEGRRGTT